MSEDAPERLRRAEAVLARRTSRVVLVLEEPWNDENVQAILRTAESFGVQHIWTVEHPHGRRRVKRAVTRGSHDWLTVRRFAAIEELVAALRADDFAVWVSDLAPGAEEVTGPEVLRPVPPRVALALGREVDGASETLLAAADRRLFLPMRGFTESYNVSVAAALLLQRLFDADEELVGAMPELERQALREVWYPRLGGRDERKRSRFVEHLAAPPAPAEDPRPREEHRQPRIRKRSRWRRDSRQAEQGG